MLVLGFGIGFFPGLGSLGFVQECSLLLLMSFSGFCTFLWSLD
jgi:hypothetical protein